MSGCVAGKQVMLAAELLGWKRRATRPVFGHAAHMHMHRPAPDLRRGWNSYSIARLGIAFFSYSMCLCTVEERR